MDFGRLTLDQGPDLQAPVRFFLTAPLFGVLAAFGLMIGGPAILISRWTPQLLGITHFMTVGFLSMAMCGALFQLLPVVAGAAIYRASVVSIVLHRLLVVGSLTLGLGLWSGSRIGLVGAIASLAIAAVVVGSMVCHAWLRASTHRPTVVAMGGAVLAFLAAAGLGLVLAAGHAGAPFGVVRDLTDLHARVGLVGWVAVLVIGVAYQVVPMFQLTPAYPHGLSILLVPTLLAALVASGAELLRWPAEVTVAIGLATFAALTLRLQSRRRRPRSDVTLKYWRLAMICLLFAVVLWTTHALFPSTLGDSHLSVALGVLYIVGFGTSVISGMLYKIVPFLVWLHVQRGHLVAVAQRGRPVTMAGLIPEARGRLQFIIHLAGVASLLAAAYRPQWATYPAAALLLVAWSALWLNLWTAVRKYRQLAAPEARERGSLTGQTLP